MQLLEAVNYMLSLTGSAEVATLEHNLPDIIAAKKRIEENRRSLLKKGWWFNTDLNVKLDPNDTGEIVVANALKVKGTSMFVSLLNGKLYNPSNQSSIFTQCVYADVTRDYEWDFLPESVQDYIMRKSGKDMVVHELEDYNKAQLLEAEVQAALLQVKKEEFELQPRNVFTNPGVIKTRGGVRPYRNGRYINPNYPGGKY
jgi:hypothetical protein